jgi:purine-nucleoside phosphorylase
LVIKDHLNLMGDNPLLGLRDSVTGSAQFVEMAGAYDAHLRQAVRDAAAESGLLLREGVLACVAGPTYETAAEAEMLGRLGAQAVSMSLVPEVIVARAFQLQVLGLAVLTNRAGLPMDHRLGHHQVVAEAEGKVKTVAFVIETVLQFLQAMETKPRGKVR